MEGQLPRGVYRGKRRVGVVELSEGRRLLNSGEILGSWEAQLPLLNSVFIFNRVEMAELRA